MIVHIPNRFSVIYIFGFLSTFNHECDAHYLRPEFVVWEMFSFGFSQVNLSHHSSMQNKNVMTLNQTVFFSKQPI